MKLVTREQMLAIERSAVEAGVSLDKLMGNAGLAVAEAVRSKLSGLTDSTVPGNIFGKRIVILVGPGNNGSDGLIAGRHLAIWGANVTAVLCLNRKTPDSKRILAESVGVSVVGITLLPDGSSDIGSFREQIATADVVIDAILGTGSSRTLSEPLSSLIFAVVESAVPVIALDLPTGLNSDNGAFDIDGLPADITLMLGYPKLGPALEAGSAPTGRTNVLDIGIPPGLDSHVNTELLTSEIAISLLPLRPTDGHKGTFGSALIIAGSKDYLGAVTMATDASTRSGAGLTFVATPEPAYQRIAGSVSEAMYRSLPVTLRGDIDPRAALGMTLELANRSDSVVVGPGMGQSPDATEFLVSLLPQLNRDTPLVLDADALNILAETYRWWEWLENPAVLTPHPGEMSRLLGITTTEVQANRLGVALEAARKFNKVIVLKGAATLIASPDGRVMVSPWVNSGLAKGGSGDVLAGLLGGLLAQEPTEVFEMASLAVFVHGYAADAARNEIGETGMRATDVTDRLGRFYRDLA
ncbi:MAG: NAD(P)H-hydrate dehydratase [Chloroflexi bacterium]|nr:NAD(P)H-hydrate dehydratase [Chloroflexota bacterium]